MNKDNKLNKFLMLTLSIVLLIGIVLFTFYCIDMNRMKNNKEVFFSTWGYSYVPPINLPQKELNLAINDYLINKLDSENKHENEKGFVSYKTYLIEEKEKNKIYNLYCWVLEEKYYLEDEKIKQDTSSSIPYKFIVKKIDNKFSVVDSRIPRDGSYYSEDMKNIFPKNVIADMNDVDIKKLKDDINKQVKLYFKNK